MAIPNQGWLPSPLNGAITIFTLPEVFHVYYYVCNPGPYADPKYYELPIIEWIAINQQPVADAGYKHGTWGWFAGIDWTYAYGDALIDSVWPPTPPTSDDETCPGNDDVADDTCPPDFILAVEPEVKEVFMLDTRVAPVVTLESQGKTVVDSEARATPILKADDRPA